MMPLTLPHLDSVMFCVAKAIRELLLHGVDHSPRTLFPTSQASEEAMHEAVASARELHARNQVLGDLVHDLESGKRAMLHQKQVGVRGFLRLLDSADAVALRLLTRVCLSTPLH